MIIFGIVLLIIGFVMGIAIVWTIGVIVLVVGLILWEVVPRFVEVKRWSPA
jgi:uncharacterized membrane protein HdeD (DUF308 family)